MLNHIILQGRLTKDPELRYTRSNTPVASFRIASEGDIKDRDGNRKTEFVDCVAWRGTGEFVSKYFFKGDMIIVSGRLEIRGWTDDKGGKHQSAEVNVQNAYFCAAKKERGNPLDAIPPDSNYSGFDDLDDDTDIDSIFGS